MRRDMDLVRRILSELSESGNPLPAAAFADGAHSEREVAYHFRIMRMGGLIYLNEPGGGGPMVEEAAGLTWAGHEFLDDVRSDDVWRKVKEKVSDTTGSASFAAIASLAELLVMNAAARGWADGANGASADEGGSDV